MSPADSRSLTVTTVPYLKKRPACGAKTFRCCPHHVGPLYVPSGAFHSGYWVMVFKVFKTYFWLSPYPYLDPHRTKIAHDVLLCKVIQYFGFKPNDNIWQWWSPTFGRGVFPRAKRRPRGHLTLFTKAAMVLPRSIHRITGTYISSVRSNVQVNMRVAAPHDVT